MQQIHIRIDLCLIFSAVFISPLLSVGMRFKRVQETWQSPKSRDVVGEVFIIDFPFPNGLPIFSESIFF